jgi:hypothetical protein
LLVTSPLIVTLPFFGIEDDVRVSMVSDSGESWAAAGGTAVAAAAPTAAVCMGPAAAAGMPHPSDASATRAGSSVERRGTLRW